MERWRTEAIEFRREQERAHAARKAEEARIIRARQAGRSELDAVVEAAGQAMGQIRAQLRDEIQAAVGELPAPSSSTARRRTTMARSSTCRTRWLGRYALPLDAGLACPPGCVTRRPHRNALHPSRSGGGGLGCEGRNQVWLR